jgi:hypothetical protein
VTKYFCPNFAQIFHVHPPHLTCIYYVWTLWGWSL